MDYGALLDLATDLGYELAMAGAETFRIEESIQRVMAAYGMEAEPSATGRRIRWKGISGLIMSARNCGGIRCPCSMWDFSSALRVIPSSLAVTGSISSAAVSAVCWLVL